MKDYLYKQKYGKKGNVKYIREEIPDFEVPEYKGERYEALVPDTLDLQYRAELAVNVLTSSTNPDADYEIYFGTGFSKNPPSMGSSFDSICQMKYIEVLPLMRIISGSRQNEMVDRRWMEVLLHMQAPDGLLYTPLKGRPWGLGGLGFLFIPSPYWEKVKEGKSEHYVCPIWARTLTAMMIYHHRDGGILWKETAERYVDGLARLAVDKGRYAFFVPTPAYAEIISDDFSFKLPEFINPEYGKMTGVDTWIGCHVMFLTLALVHVYEEINYEPALQLAGKLIGYLLEELKVVDGEGRSSLYIKDSRAQPGGMAHFHTYTYIMLGILEYGIQSGDERLIDLVRKGYEYARMWGETLTGYFPEHFGSMELEHSEMCEVADMIQLGLRLTRLGKGDYWDDIDRWVRNMFAEGQLTPDKADNLIRYSKNQPLTGTTDVDSRKTSDAGETEEKKEINPEDSEKLFGDAINSGMAGNSLTAIDQKGFTTDHVIERNIGGFCGQPMVNDWEGAGPIGCCTGNGTRAIYYIWQDILIYDSGKLKINLLLNRASAWADVDSHIPYKGQVDVKVKKAVNLSIRIPEWVKPEEVRVQVNGNERSLLWEGRYALVGDVNPGDVATMIFPIWEREDTVWIEKRKYTITRKGNDIVAIDPPGRICPLYQREHYRQDYTRWVKVERFVSDENIRR